MTQLQIAWEGLKQERPEALLLLRLGDFYECFYRDAETLGRLMCLTITKRGDIPMCGFAYHMKAEMLRGLKLAGITVRVMTKAADAWRDEE